jgi:glycosyltransferase involved in cell wall biosynthesis
MRSTQTHPEKRRRRAESGETVAVVLTTFNDFDFLHEALASVMAQTHSADEIILVDDGSSQDPSFLLEAFPQVRLLRKPNGGLSSARNAGMHQATSNYIAFLDADDRLAPHAIAAGLACFRRHPAAAMVYGGYRRISPDGNVLGPDQYEPIAKDAYEDMLRMNRIGMHAAVLYRRAELLSLRGFDETLRLCEDYDLYLRLARQYLVASHPEIVADYRRHGRNVSADPEKMLRAVLAVHDRHRKQGNRYRRAWRAGERSWKAHYIGELRAAAGHANGNRRSLGNFIGELRYALRPARPLAKALLTRSWARLRGTTTPPVGAIDFGSFATTRPLSRDFGWDRGTPVDRYYIERFLNHCAADIRGGVLEVGDDTYSKRYGGDKISAQAVLHRNPGHPGATLTGDMTQPGVLPESLFDCIVLTQTLQLIFEPDQALLRLHAALKHDGVLLLTVPGISQTDRGEWGGSWFWSFTEASLRRLLERHFPSESFTIETNGNVYSAICFLEGAALEEIDTAQLDMTDAAYPVILTVRARKG